MTVSFEDAEVESEEFECAECLVSGMSSWECERTRSYNVQMKTLCGFRYARRRERELGAGKTQTFLFHPTVVRQE